MCPPSSLQRTDISGSQSDSRIWASDLSSVIPTSIVCKSAFDLAESLLPAAILNHSIRVYLYAKLLSQDSDSAYFRDSTKHDLLFVSCIMHDIGTASRFDGDQRFEVEGGDAAVSHLLSHNFSESEAHEAWTAIALHTSPGIAERINELTRLVRQAVLLDFGRGWETKNNIAGLTELKREWEGKRPRLGVEKVLGDAVVAQAVRNSIKAPAASWPNNLYKAHLQEPDWDGVNKGF